MTSQNLESQKLDGQNLERQNLDSHSLDGQNLDGQILDSHRPNLDRKHRAPYSGRNSKYMICFIRRFR